MTYALIADIHGNFPALLAVLRDAKERGADSFVFAGDYIFDLPFSNEVTDCLRAMKNAFVVRGNKEERLPWLRAEQDSLAGIEQIGALTQTLRELTPENLDYLLSLPESLRIPLTTGGEMLVQHDIPALRAGEKKINCSSSQFRREMQRATFDQAEFRAITARFLETGQSREAIGALCARVVVFGHVHLQWHGFCGDTLVINPGSCGQPLDYSPLASYTLLRDTPEALRVEERRVAYDIEEAIRKAKGSAVCKAGELFCRLVFRALRTGHDEFGVFFALARKIAEERGEPDGLFSNVTWREAGRLYFGEAGTNEL